jgi:hypothetical protein
MQQLFVERKFHVLKCVERKSNIVESHSRNVSVEEDEGTSKLAAKLLSSKLAQNWFFTKPDGEIDVPPRPHGAAAGSASEAAVRAAEAAKQAKQYNVWAPQTM